MIAKLLAYLERDYLEESPKGYWIFVAFLGAVFVMVFALLRWPLTLSVALEPTTENQGDYWSFNVPAQQVSRVQEALSLVEDARQETAQATTRPQVLTASVGWIHLQHPALPPAKIPPTHWSQVARSEGDDILIHVPYSAELQPYFSSAPLPSVNLTYDAFSLLDTFFTTFSLSHPSDGEAH